MYSKDFSEEELKQKSRRIRSFIKGYRAGEQQIADLMLQEEWQEVRRYAFRMRSNVH